MKPKLHMIVVLMFWQGLNSITSKASAEIMQLFKGLAVFAEDQTVPGEKCGEMCLNDGDYCLYLFTAPVINLLWASMTHELLSGLKLR